jgi:uncharacterized protein with NRDE domain
LPHGSDPTPWLVFTARRGNLRCVCTVVVSVRPGHSCPVALVANRDERLARPWDPPAAWWPDQPDVVAGRDRLAGGTWMGVNRHGVMAAVLNRQGSLGPTPGKLSRGDLPLLALCHETAATAARALEGLDGGRWRGFNMVLADARGAIFVRSQGQGHPQSWRLPAGVSMVTSHDPNDMDSPRVARHLPRFQAAPAPESDDWEAWRAILADTSGLPEQQINVEPRAGYGTSCSSFVAWPADGKPLWLFAAGPPDHATFTRVP